MLCGFKDSGLAACSCNFCWGGGGGGHVTGVAPAIYFKAKGYQNYMGFCAERSFLATSALA